MFGAARDALNFSERLPELVIVEIVKRVDRNDEIEMFVRPGELGSRADLAERFDALHYMFDAIFQNIDAGHFDVRQRFTEIMQDEALAGADIEDAHARLD